MDREEINLKTQNSKRKTKTKNCKSINPRRFKIYDLDLTFNT